MASGYHFGGFKLFLSTILVTGQHLQRINHVGKRVVLKIKIKKFLFKVGTFYNSTTDVGLGSEV